MDVDALRAARQAEWDRLAELAGTRRIDGRETDELIGRYQDAAADLSEITTTSGASQLGDRLSVTIARARMRFTGVGGNLFSALPRFFLLELPAALYRLRWWTLVIAAASAIVALAYGFWIGNDPAAIATFGSNADLKQYADNDFTGYYSDNPAAAFAGQVWTNNAFIAAQCIAFGILGVWVPYTLLENAKNVGIAGGILSSYGRGGEFWLYIAPHGLLELTSVFVAGAAGMRIFWAWIAPGRRTRAQALAEDGRALFVVAIGLMLSLFVSGCVEGFVTGSPLPWPVKIGIGVVVWAGFLAYMLVVGRRAYRAGETGDLAEADAGARQVVAD